MSRSLSDLLHWHTDQAQPHWKATFRRAPVLSYALFRRWDETTRVYRWRWAAKLAAFRYTFGDEPGVLTNAMVEPYWSGANVIPFRRSPPSRNRSNLAQQT